MGVKEGAANFYDVHERKEVKAKCPYGRPGDVLYVRESWFPAAINGERVLIAYYDQDAANAIEIAPANNSFYWKQMQKSRMIPSIHMPKEAARIWLKVTDIRVERLQDISEADAIAEGLKCITKDGKLYKFGIPDSDGYPGTDDSGWPWQEWEARAEDAYKKLWKKINGRESWDANPWVWVISFEVLSTTGNTGRR
jgi:hypothetical protein